MKRRLMLIYAVIWVCGLIAQDLDCHSDTDEWLSQRKLAATNPFAKVDSFCINFANYNREDWCYPLKGAHIISPFGGARHHAGTDVKNNPGDTIRAVFDGEVIISGPYFAYGNCVVIRHANGLETLYSHNETNLVRVGQWVFAGQALATEGRTGRATTEHLHFETRVHGKAFDSDQLFDHNANLLLPQVVVFKKEKDGHITLHIKDKK